MCFAWNGSRGMHKIQQHPYKNWVFAFLQEKKTFENEFKFK